MCNFLKSLGVFVMGNAAPTAEALPKAMVEVAPKFFNIRGSFKIGGVVDVGTQTSLVQRPSGKWLFLDSYTLTDDVLESVKSLTNNGDDVEAIINVHPFHTIHVEWMTNAFPEAKLFGSQRHKEKFPSLKWESTLVEDPTFPSLFSDTLEFEIPKGVDFISANENVHFSSVLAYHKDSKTVHVDDTWMYTKLINKVALHPTLAQALEKRAGAADDFENWMKNTLSKWDVRNLCAAHTWYLLSSESLNGRLQQALSGVKSTLDAHRKKYGVASAVSEKVESQ